MLTANVALKIYVWLVPTGVLVCFGPLTRFWRTSIMGTSAPLVTFPRVLVALRQAQPLSMQNSVDLEATWLFCAQKIEHLGKKMAR